MRVLKQIGAVTMMNLKSVPQRLGASSVIVIGIAGVVGVLVSILAMVGGLSHMMTSTGRADRAIVVSAGASFETLSNITREAPLGSLLIAFLVGVAVARRGSGRDAASRRE